MSEISVINFIEVPHGMESKAEDVRGEYVSYFKEQEGYVGSIFYKSLDSDNEKSTKYVNIVVWDSYNSYQNVVNMGFTNLEGKNSDGMKVLGKGFPEPIKVSPGHYTVIG